VNYYPPQTSKTPRYAPIRAGNDLGRLFVVGEHPGSGMVGAEGLEPPTPCVWSTGATAKTNQEGGVACNPQNPVRDLYANRQEAGGAVDLATALRALADAGLPPEALAAAVEALVRASKAAAGPAARKRGAASA
jgi:hypothetical protein